MRLLILLSLVIGSAWAMCGCGEKPASGPPPALARITLERAFKPIQAAEPRKLRRPTSKAQVSKSATQAPKSIRSWVVSAFFLGSCCLSSCPVRPLSSVARPTYYDHDLVLIFEQFRTIGPSPVRMNRGHAFRNVPR